MIKTGIKDSYGREINYMRISITDRCNLRCRYCMPDGAEWIPMKEILTYEEITEVCQEAVKLGITRFKITGGEPLVRRGCPEVIRMIKNIPGTELVTLTTNGLLLGEQLEALLSAGLDAVNISLDTLDIKKYEWITGFDKLAVVLSSIEKAVASGIPVKINAVLQKGMNEEEWLPLTELARKLPLSVRFIEMMPIGYGNMSESISNEELKETIRKHYGNLTEDFRVYGNGPAVYYSIEGFQGNVGFIQRQRRYLLRLVHRRLGGLRCALPRCARVRGAGIRQGDVGLGGVGAPLAGGGAAARLGGAAALLGAAAREQGEGKAKGQKQGKGAMLHHFRSNSFLGGSIRLGSSYPTLDDGPAQKVPPDLKNFCSPPQRTQDTRFPVFSRGPGKSTAGQPRASAATGISSGVTPISASFSWTSRSSRVR